MRRAFFASMRALACTACHGKEGRAGPDGYYPRLAHAPDCMADIACGSASRPAGRQAP